MSQTLVLAVLISGNGSNLQSIIDAIEQDRLDAEIKLVISNNPDAYGLVRAARHGIATRVLDHREYTEREQFDLSLRSCLESIAPDYVVLAGFMRILGPVLVDAFAHRILNIHPSLLPAYKGLNTHRRALENNETRHGVSIHLVTAGLDDGPVLLQGSYSINAGDRVKDLQQKGHALEHQMYPQLLRWLAENKLSIKQGKAFYDDVPLDTPLQFRP